MHARKDKGEDPLHSTVTLNRKDCMEEKKSSKGEEGGSDREVF